MNNYLKFFVLSMLLLVPLGMMEEARVVSEGDVSIIQHLDDERFDTGSTGEAAPINVDTPAEAESNNSNVSPDWGNPADDNHGPAYRESSLKNYISTRLFLFRTTERGFTGLTLIYPFHFFF